MSERRRVIPFDWLPFFGLTGVAAGVAFALLPVIPAGFAVGFAALALAVAMIDLRAMIIPDRLSGALALLGLVASLVVPLFAGEGLPGLMPQPGEPVAGWLLAQVLNTGIQVLGGALLLWGLRLSYRWLRGCEAIGLGDVKLMAALGLWLDLEGQSLALALACVAALVLVGLQLLLGRQPVSRSSAVPFGAFLAPAGWLIWVAFTGGFLSSDWLTP